MCAVLALAGCHAQEPPVQPFRTGAEMFVQMLQNSAPRQVDYWQSLMSPETGVAVVANQSSLVGESHLVDTLLRLGLNVKAIFCPEHGFRGTAAAGERVDDAMDARTGLPLYSLYGKNKKPSDAQMKGIDIVVFDLQDVGCRFYTYLSTLHYVMEACADNNVLLIVLDRPNPNGHYVDGPVLDTARLRSFVGMHPVPIVYGMTIGEYALMIAGEHWLDIVDSDYYNPDAEHLFVMKMQGYCRDSVYALPIPPSPNLRNAHAVALYPSLCLFEGTNVSVGRGTDWPFEVVGTPYSKMWNRSSAFGNQKAPAMVFTPRGGKKCFGVDLRGVEPLPSIDLTWLKLMYNLSRPGMFFLKNNFFDKLAGTTELRRQLERGAGEEEIRASWQEGLERFRTVRSRYLLYPDIAEEGRRE